MNSLKAGMLFIPCKYVQVVLSLIVDRFKAIPVACTHPWHVPARVFQPVLSVLTRILTQPKPVTLGKGGGFLGWGSG
jgi:hypothetical protein